MAPGPRHHAYAVAAEAGEGVAAVRAWLAQALGLAGLDNPDIVVLSHELLTVAAARRAAEVAATGPAQGEVKAVVIAAARAYHEAQNALLKLFEEPPAGTYLFLILPTLGELVPTLASRVVALPIVHTIVHTTSEAAQAFIRASREGRGAIIKKITAAKGEGTGSALEKSDEALALVDGIEAAAYAAGSTKHQTLLTELATVRGYLHERSAPVKLILEHLALVTPRNLVS